MKTENIGYWWLGCEIRTPGGRKVKAKIWWGVCKKTRKVALVGTTNIYPIVVTSTHITEYDSKKECFDAPMYLIILNQWMKVILKNILKMLMTKQLLLTLHLKRSYLNKECYVW